MLFAILSINLEAISPVHWTPHTDGWHQSHCHCCNDTFQFYFIIIHHLFIAIKRGFMCVHANWHFGTAPRLLNEPRVRGDSWRLEDSWMGPASLFRQFLTSRVLLFTSFSSLHNRHCCLLRLSRGRFYTLRFDSCKFNFFIFPHFTLIFTKKVCRDHDVVIMMMKVLTFPSGFFLRTFSSPRT